MKLLNIEKLLYSTWISNISYKTYGFYFKKALYTIHYIIIMSINIIYLNHKIQISTNFKVHET